MFLHDPVLKASRVFEQRRWPTHAPDFVDAWGEADIVFLMDHFQNLLGDIDKRALLDQWKCLKIMLLREKQLLSNRYTPWSP